MEPDVAPSKSPEKAALAYNRSAIRRHRALRPRNSSARLADPEAAQRHATTRRQRLLRLGMEANLSPMAMNRWITANEQNTTSDQQTGRVSPREGAPHFHNYLEDLDSALGENRNDTEFSPQDSRTLSTESDQRQVDIARLYRIRQEVQRIGRRRPRPNTNPESQAEEALQVWNRHADEARTGVPRTGGLVPRRGGRAAMWTEAPSPPRQQSTWDVDFRSMSFPDHSAAAFVTRYEVSIRDFIAIIPEEALPFYSIHHLPSYQPQTT